MNGGKKNVVITIIMINIVIIDFRNEIKKKMIKKCARKKERKTRPKK